MLNARLPVILMLSPSAAASAVEPSPRMTGTLPLILQRRCLLPSRAMKYGGCPGYQWNSNFVHATSSNRTNWWGAPSTQHSALCPIMGIDSVTDLSPCLEPLSVIKLTCFSVLSKPRECSRHKHLDQETFVHRTLCSTLILKEGSLISRLWSRVASKLLD